MGYGDSITKIILYDQAQDSTGHTGTMTRMMMMMVHRKDGGWWVRTGWLAEVEVEVVEAEEEEGSEAGAQREVKLTKRMSCRMRNRHHN